VGYVDEVIRGAGSVCHVGIGMDMSVIRGAGLVCDVGWICHIATNPISVARHVLIEGCSCCSVSTHPVIV
jgi:hypothetical protein